MFWLNSKTKKNKKTTAKASRAKADENSCVGNGKGQCAGPLKGDALRAQALANARAAREALGDETIQKIAEAMKRKKNSPLERAKEKIAQTDAERVAAEIIWMMEETRH